jgi:hypothetical protein
MIPEKEIGNRRGKQKSQMTQFVNELTFSGFSMVLRVMSNTLK